MPSMWFSSFWYVRQLQIVGFDHFGLVKHQAALEDVFEFANVAAPRVGLERLDGLWRNLRQVDLQGFADLLQEVVHERRDIFFAVPE